MFNHKIIFTEMLEGFDYSSNYRKCIVSKIKPKTGIIVGRVIRYEGKYIPTVESHHCFGGYEYGEEGSLTERKGVWFWRVFTDLNKEYLIPIK